MSLAVTTFFGPDGKSIGGTQLYLPPYLDWMPIELKTYWFLERGLGEPAATHVLLSSQGEQQLSPITSPLRNMQYTELMENENGLESKVDEYAERNRINRTPRNQ